MASLEGFDNNDFASFDSQEPTVQQLPSLPVDDVLPEANKDVSKTVQFKENEEMIVNPEANVILPSQSSVSESSTTMDILKSTLEEYSPYIFALIFILIAYWYSQKY